MPPVAKPLQFAVLLALAVIWAMAMFTARPEEPAQPVLNTYSTDALLYRQSLDELEAQAHAKGQSVAELAASLGTDREHLIGLVFAAKKKREQAEQLDRDARSRDPVVGIHP